MMSSVPRPGRTYSLRDFALIAASCILVYIVGFAMYLAGSVAPRADRLRDDTIPVLALFEELSGRADRIERAITQAHGVTAGGSSTALDSLRAFIVASGRVEPALVAYAPPEMRGALVRAEALTSSIETKLHELVANVELGRTGEALLLLDQVHSIQSEVGQVLVDAERIGLRELSAREQALSSAISSAITLVAWWVVVGVMLVVVLLATVQRLVQRPLAQIEGGLNRVSQGDLNARVVVYRNDELGGLASHFNEMTSVLRARAEEQGRFAAAGQLIAGVAHEVNNPLMAIASLADTRLEEPDLDEELRGELLQIRRQARRAGKLLSGLLRFVRASELPSTSLSLNEVIRSATDLVSYRFSVEEVTLVERLDPFLPPALGGVGRLEQVFVNLLSNAVDAMRGAPLPRVLEVETWCEDGRVCVAIADTGPGIPPEMEHRLFHPFATTKGASGTGLGLYISRQIVREGGGDIIYEPAAAGARFVLHLPATPITVVPLGDTAPRTGESDRRGLEGIRVLVVDDEDAVRAPIVKYLMRRGAQVSEAKDGLEGLEVLERNPADVILADLRMPRMDGAAMWARLNETRPELAGRTIILSGDLSQLDGRLPVPQDRVLVKPVELKEIEAKIRSVARHAERQPASRL